MLKSNKKESKNSISDQLSNADNESPPMKHSDTSIKFVNKFIKNKMGQIIDLHEQKFKLMKNPQTIKDSRKND